MSFPTRGLSWLAPNVAAIVRDFRDTSERLGFKGAVDPATWAEIEREHIRASAALCHLLADYEKPEVRRQRLASVDLPPAPGTFDMRKLVLDVERLTERMLKKPAKRRAKKRT